MLTSMRPPPNEGTPLKGAAAEEPKPKRRELSSPVHAFVNELKCLIGVEQGRAIPLPHLEPAGGAILHALC